MQKIFVLSTCLALGGISTMGVACSDSADTTRLDRPGPGPVTDRSDGGETSTDGGIEDGGTDPTGDAEPPKIDAPFFSVAYVEDHATMSIPGQDLTKGGDLWPSCWGDDDALYTANGDGVGFGGNFDDIVVSRITGSPFTSPPNLQGTSLARTDAVGSVWTPQIKQGTGYNRKPTGMFCADGDIYLAIQDLRYGDGAFNDAPAASISVSHDHGKTWSWDKTKPMFDHHKMTTLMFLDFGKNNEHALDSYAYVYGLDQNWRFSTSVPSPTKLWLARVPKDKIQDRSAWTFFAGTNADGTPRFDADIDQRVAVLDDPRTVYNTPESSGTARAMTVLSQGSIVYNAPLKRYLYTSWTEYTFEFYEAEAPWGPWKPFLSRDFGSYKWTADVNGGYTTTIPSKFISPDGKTMFVQSNTFTSGITNYSFSMRKLWVEPFVDTTPSNPTGTANLAMETGTRPFSRAGHNGSSLSIYDGQKTGSLDSWTGDLKEEDFWGLVWPRTYRINRVEYTTGKMFGNGGWFADLRVQYRYRGKWQNVSNTSASPAYPNSNQAGDNTTYTFDFDEVVADGIRVIGSPGGSTTFTSISELGAFLH